MISIISNSLVSVLQSFNAATPLVVLVVMVALKLELVVGMFN